MTKNRTALAGEKGAALVIVLLLVATMSFIALAISERTALSARRSVNAAARSEALWLGTGAEALARAALKAAAEGSDKMTPDSPLFAAPIELPMEGGGAVMAFADRTRCFNLNTLIAAGEGDEQGPNEDAAKEFAALIDASGASGGEGVIAAIVDWIDADSLQEPRGAEDGVYAGLPTPYRTGAGPLADISEIRAMSGVDRALYQSLASHLCAYPGGAPVGVNVNMLDTDDAPLLAALTGGKIAAAEAAEAIRDRPAAGYESAEAFWAQQAFAGMELSEAQRGRARLTSGYIEAYAVITYAEATVNLSMLFEVSGEGGPRLISRRLERFD